MILLEVRIEVKLTSYMKKQRHFLSSDEKCLVVSPSEFYSFPIDSVRFSSEKQFQRMALFIYLRPLFKLTTLIVW